MKVERPAHAPVGSLPGSVSNRLDFRLKKAPLGADWGMWARLRVCTAGERPRDKKTEAQESHLGPCHFKSLVLTRYQSQQPHGCQRERSFGNEQPLDNRKVVVGGGHQNTSMAFQSQLYHYLLPIKQGPGFSHAARDQQTSTHDSEDDGLLVHVNEIRQYTGKNQTLEILPHSFQAVQISGGLAAEEQHMESLPLGSLVSRAPAPGWEKSPDMEDSTLHPQSGPAPRAGGAGGEEEPPGRAAASAADRLPPPLLRAAGLRAGPTYPSNLTRWSQTSACQPFTSLACHEHLFLHTSNGNCHYH
ncbi:hypothetical protein J1605_019962 [Eschrichtius robustus]|uniref:Uncharacterized protein n=1 Tax=Eschrichtius robustus TaxID=9764 RepID=A0AB34HN62_ESCRO|nr:hypothetical protein J1605_019962 [Eschrichtius robustus]